MFASAIVYAGVVLAGVGVISLLRPVRMLGIRTRRRAAGIVVVAISIVAVGLLLPAPERRVTRASSQLDEVLPVWQFGEFHRIHVRASPEKVFEAVKAVTAEEIRLFRTLTWLRRFGREGPESLLNAPERMPILDVALRGGFIGLADQPPREILVGTVVVAPPGVRGGSLTPEIFRTLGERPGFALAAMNFLVTPAAEGAELSTETRVFATSDDACRRFSVYWRVIYPGSAIIRRMWLRAVRARAEQAR